jgi:hypothetical protein
LATLYDIRDNMRRLVKLGDGRLVPGQPGRGDRPGPPSVRREPRLT